MTALSMLMGQIPMLLAYAAALIILIVRWRQAPRASMLALCGVLFGLFLMVLMPLLYAWLPRRHVSGGGSTAEMSTMVGIVSIAGSIAHAVAFGFLFLAIYADRRYPSPPPPEF
ncbi:MAG: hypothetical protein ACAI34_21040 [Verrucomicrobium sp.]